MPETPWTHDKLVPLRNGSPSEVLLAVFVVDDSGSIEGSGNTSAVIEGYNALREELCRAVGNVRMRTVFLNASASHPTCVPPAETVPLVPGTYRPRDNTPLYLRTLEALQSIRAEATVLAGQGTVVRTVTILFTDGADNESGGVAAAHVKCMVDEALRADTNIVGACGVSDGCTNFWEVFHAMGIPEQWIKVLAGDPRGIRETLRDVGNLVSDASASGEAYRRASRTGFTTPDDSDPT